MVAPIEDGGIIDTLFEPGSQSSHTITMQAQAGVGNGPTYSCSGPGSVTAASERVALALQPSGSVSRNPL